MTSDETPRSRSAPASLRDEFVPAVGEPIDPVAMARRDLTKTLPRRFYKEAGVADSDGAYALTLDGKQARTPGRKPLALPTLAAAQALAAEWARQAEVVNPADMPLTRIVNSAIDGVALQADAVVADVARYGASDLVCYRAEGPQTLAAAQSAAWDGLLDFARDALGARLICSQGVAFVEQPAPARAAILAAAQEVAHEGGPLALTALHVMTTLTGSALIALAVARGVLGPQQAWRVAHVDEDHQMALWGADEQALAARARRWNEMEAAAILLKSLRAPPST